ncbi:MAG: sigma-54-dependent Fis family transcriptional regulator [Ignavibacteriales bacterium]|nr:sigma-54-dependent Fis family transcriptional regulator [Ignavibacteriales bacterium]
MAKKFHVLIVDDEESITYLLKTEFEELNAYEVDTALNGAEAINLIQSRLYDIVLLDVKMPRVSGMEVLKHVKEHSPSTQVIMLTNVVDVKIAIETIKLGAYDFVSKPYDVDQLFATVRRALEHRQLIIEREVSQSGRANFPVGESRPFQAVIANAVKVAASDTFVLIQGGSGTGKELFAQMIHQHSPRKDQPFVAVNCAAMPDQLLESELFGHEKGAFTSAFRTKEGLVEVANGGTLFLDEVGDISTLTQPKLLRFLETGEFRRVGGTTPRKVDVRVVSATNKNLQNEVKAGRFRDDLLYRLNVVSIRLPELKERKEDIGLLVEHFLSRKSKTKKLSQEAMALMMKYDWPGNVRELEHVIEGAIAMSHGDLIEPKDLWMNVALSGGIPASESSSNGYSEFMTMEEVEKMHIEKVLKHNHWNRAKTAQMLGITPKTLYLKIKRYGIKVGMAEA